MNSSKNFRRCNHDGRTNHKANKHSNYNAKSKFEYGHKKGVLNSKQSIWNRFAPYKIILKEECSWLQTNNAGVYDSSIHNVDTPIAWEHIEHFVSHSVRAADISNNPLDIHRESKHDGSNTKCPICLEDQCFIPRITKCGHLYCLTCLLMYMDGRIEHKCPICGEMIVRDEWKTVSDTTTLRRYIHTKSLTNASSINRFDAEAFEYENHSLAVGSVVQAHLLHHNAKSIGDIRRQSIDDLLISRVRRTDTHIPPSNINPNKSKCNTLLPVINGDISTTDRFDCLYSRVIVSTSYVLEYINLEIQLLEVFREDCRQSNVTGSTDSSAHMSEWSLYYQHQNVDRMWLPAIAEGLYILMESRDLLQAMLTSNGNPVGKGLEMNQLALGTGNAVNLDKHDFPDLSLLPLPPQNPSVSKNKSTTASIPKDGISPRSYDGALFVANTGTLDKSSGYGINSSDLDQIDSYIEVPWSNTNANANSESTDVNGMLPGVSIFKPFKFSSSNTNAQKTTNKQHSYHSAPIDCYEYYCYQLDERLGNGWCFLHPLSTSCVVHDMNHHDKDCEGLCNARVAGVQSSSTPLNSNAPPFNPNPICTNANFLTKNHSSSDEMSVIDDRANLNSSQQTTLKPTETAPPNANKLKLPYTISGTILQVEAITVTSHTRQQYPFLHHVPMYAVAYIVELDCQKSVATGNKGLNNNKRIRNKNNSSLNETSSPISSNFNVLRPYYFNCDTDIQKSTVNYFSAELNKRVKNRKIIADKQLNDMRVANDERIAHAMYVETVKEAHREREASRASVMNDILSGPALCSPPANANAASINSYNPTMHASFATVAHDMGHFPDLNSDNSNSSCMGPVWGNKMNHNTSTPNHTHDVANANTTSNTPTGAWYVASNSNKSTNATERSIETLKTNKKGQKILVSGYWDKLSTYLCDDQIQGCMSKNNGTRSAQAP